MFQLINQTTVELLHINMRTERHGQADVDAYDFDFCIERQNSEVLALLDDRLCPSLYFRAKATDDEPDLPDVEKIFPNLLFPKMTSYDWKDEAEGVDLAIVYGLGDDKSNMLFEDGKCATKRFETKEGGTVLLYFRYSTSAMPDGALDKLRRKLKQELSITMVRPQKLIQDSIIDGTIGHPGLAAEAEKTGKGGKKKPKKDATQAFLEGQGADGAGAAGNGEAKWPFPNGGAGPQEAPPQSATTEVVIEQSQPGTRTARGRDKTKSELESGSAAAAGDGAAGQIPD